MGKQKTDASAELRFDGPRDDSVSESVRSTIKGARLTRKRTVGRRFPRISYSGILGACIIIFMSGAAVLAPLVAPYRPTEQNLDDSLLPPFSTQAGGRMHVLGTDDFGRDVLSRLIYGARVSLLVGFSSVLVQLGVGGLLGLTAGYYRGRADRVIMRIADIQLAIPFLVLALAVVAVLGPSLQNVILVLGVTGWVSYGRVIRGQVLAVREQQFVEAARAVGAPDLRILRTHIVPNVANSVIVIASLEVARMIIAEASLSFLGLGVQPPTPTWGGMVAQGRNFITIAWWIATFPGLAIFLTVLGVNLFGDWLRDLFDPTMHP
jgi:peptide/nickel transport system permease protein